MVFSVVLANRFNVGYQETNFQDKWTFVHFRWCCVWASPLAILGYRGGARVHVDTPTTGSHIKSRKEWRREWHTAVRTREEGRCWGGRREVANGVAPMQLGEELLTQRPLGPSESLGLKNPKSVRNSAENNELELGIGSSQGWDKDTHSPPSHLTLCGGIRPSVRPSTAIPGMGIHLPLQMIELSFQKIPHTHAWNGKTYHVLE